MKIYTVGSEYSLYTNQLYKKLIEKTGCTVYVDKTGISDQLLERGKNVYRDVEWRKQFGFFDFVSSAIVCLGKKNFYRDAFSHLLFKRKRFFGAMKHLQYYSWHLAKKIEQEKISVVHHNYLDVWTLAGIDYMKPGTKILCSFWGSDLMDYAFPFEYQYQHRALHKADIITVTSFELKEQVLTKFGRELEPKIRFVQFVLSENLLDKIEKNKNCPEKIKEAKNKLQIPHDKLVVCIGNSLNVYSNHKTILQNIVKLPEEIKQKIFLVVPNSYGDASELYATEIRQLLEATGCGYARLEKFLDEDELSLIRIISDIFLHAPVSDAQSGTAIETMLAGNVFLTGSFMPYSNFIKAGLKFYTFDSYNEIDKGLTDVVNNFNKYKEQCAGNAEKVKKHFAPDVLTQTWLPVFEELHNTIA